MIMLTQLLWWADQLAVSRAAEVTYRWYRGIDAFFSGVAIELGGSDGDDVTTVLFFLLHCQRTEDHPAVCNEVKPVDLAVKTC